MTTHIRTLKITDAALRSKIKERMADNRERTVNDLLCHIPVGREQMMSMLRSMALRGEIVSVNFRAGGAGAVTIYRRPE